MMQDMQRDRIESSIKRGNHGNSMHDIAFFFKSCDLTPMITANRSGIDSCGAL